jgi:hypothetical protein
MSVAAAQVEENLRFVYTLIAPIHLLRRTLTILNIMKQEALYAVYFHKKIVQYVPQSAGFLCPPNPLGNSSYCFRFRGRPD